MHEVCVETVENDLFITFSHPMTKEHYIMFAAYVTWDKMLFAKLYPEQNGELRFPRLPRGRLYYYCSRDGFFEA